MRPSRASMLLAAVGGLVGFLVGLAGSLILGIAAGLITFLGSWDAFQWPLIVTSKPDFRPVQVGLSAFRQEAGSSYHLLMAASTFVVAPIVLLFLVAQRYLVQGIARTGIRG